MLLYVSGPYSGDTSKDIDRNIKQAADISGKLWELGHAVICPHTNTGQPHLNEKNCTATYDQYINGDLHMICYCDALVMTTDWEKSKGAKIEKAYAESLDIPIYIWPDYPSLHPTEIRCPEQAKAFREEMGKMYRTHLSKNADYSPANIMATGELGLVTRLWDKTARLMNLYGFKFTIPVAGTYSTPKTPKHESIDDTLQDSAVYSIIGLLLRRGKWGK